MKATVRERLLSRLVIDQAGCLLWQGYIDRTGYGRITIARRSIRVHIVAWELEHGPVPPGLELDHVKDRGCRYRHCANIAHLEPVTRQENLRRSDLTMARRNAAKTHCPHNHPYDEANTYVLNGRRFCRACRLAAYHRRAEAT